MPRNMTRAGMVAGFDLDAFDHRAICTPPRAWRSTW
jgi:hypothetical protein